MKVSYLTEKIRGLTIKLLKKITEDIAKVEGEDCYAWISQIGEALEPVVKLSRCLTDVNVEDMCELLDYVEEENWDSIYEKIGDGINDSQKSI